MTQPNDELKHDKLYLILKLQTELQQTREELEQEKQRFLQQWRRAVIADKEVEYLRTELAAKDKVLQSIATAPAYTARRWYRDQASFILSQYKGEDKA